MAGGFDRKELEAWLETQPREVAVAIAVRAALRVFPLTGATLRDADAGKRAADIILPVYRALTAPWAAAKYPAYGAELIAAAYAAAYAAVNAAKVTAYVAQGAATNAATNAALAATAAANAAAAAANARAVTAVLEAAVTADFAATADFADALRRAMGADRAEIEGGASLASLAALAGRPLWPDSDPPYAIAAAWAEMRRTLLSLDPNWRVWTDWYDDRLYGRSAIEALEIARATLPDELWNQGPAAVNARIAELIAEHAPEAGKPGGEDGEEQAQSPAAFWFRMIDAQVDVAPPGSDLTVDPRMRDDMAAALIEVLRDLQQAGTQSNQGLPTGLEMHLGKLAAFLGSADAKRAGMLLSVSRPVLLRIARLEARGGSGSELLDELLLDVHAALEDLKSCYADILVIERDGLRRTVTPEVADQLIVVLERIAQAVEQLPNDLTPAARKALRTIADAALDEEDPATRVDLAVDQTLVDRNLAKMTASSLRKLRKEIAGEVKKELRDQLIKQPARWAVRRIARAILPGFEEIAKLLPDMAKIPVELARLLAATEDAADELSDDEIDEA